MPRELRILFVDDQSTVRDAFELLARALGHRATTVGSPDAALQELERACFDVLITDDDLDDLVTGPLLIAECRRRGFPVETPTILLSSTASPPQLDSVVALQKAADDDELVDYLGTLAAAPRLTPGGLLPVVQRTTDPFLTALPKS